MDTKFYYNFNRICRICLCEGNNMLNIFDSHVVSEDVLIILGGLQISRDDGLPSQICPPCFTEVTLVSHFKTKCELSNLTLRNYLMKIEQVPDILKEENLYPIHDLEKSFAPITDYIPQPFDLDTGSSFIKFESNDACDQNINTDFFKPISNEPEEGFSNKEPLLSSKYQISSAVKQEISHKNIKLPGKTNVCCICEMGAADYDSLRKHMDIHLKPTNHCCKKCSCYFITELQLQRHNERLHPENSIDTEVVFFSNHIYKTDAENDMDKVELLSDFDFLDEPEIKLQNEVAFDEKHPDEDISTFNITNMTNFSEDSRLNGFIGDLIDENLARFESIECAGSPGSNFEPFQNSSENNERKYSKKRKSSKERKKHHFLTYKCHLCPVVFKKYLNFREHMNAAHGLNTAIKPFMCDNCNKGFSRRQQLIQHLQTHKLKQCKECNEKFTRSADLMAHMKHEHVPSKDDMILCPMCGKSFFSTRKLKSHQQREHEGKPLLCNICGMAFSFKNNLNIHIRMHRNENGEPFKKHESAILKKLIMCTWCGKSCKGSSNFKVHMRRHTGHMTCVCKVCGRGYPRMTDLTIHMRKHTGERPYICKICSKGFMRSDSLSIHMRIHTGEKPFACECGDKFSQKNVLEYHKRSMLETCMKRIFDKMHSKKTQKIQTPLTSTPLHEPTSDILLNLDTPIGKKTENQNKMSNGRCLTNQTMKETLHSCEKIQIVAGKNLKELQNLNPEEI